LSAYIHQYAFGLYNGKIPPAEEHLTIFYVLITLHFAKEIHFLTGVYKFRLPGFKQYVKINILITITLPEFAGSMQIRAEFHPLK